MENFIYVFILILIKLRDIQNVVNYVGILFRGSLYLSFEFSLFDDSVKRSLGRINFSVGFCIFFYVKSPIQSIFHTS